MRSSQSDEIFTGSELFFKLEHNKVTLAEESG
jgi:hypothetical protein